MSLKSFHIVFVTISTLLFSFLAVWSFLFSPENSGIFNALGYVGIAGLVLMPVYGVYFLRKARQIHI